MRFWAIFAVLAMVGCSAQPQGNSAAMGNAGAGDVLAPPPAPPPVPAGMRGPEPATSPSAAAAKALVDRYYALIKQKKFAAARKLWADNGAAAGGDAAAFAATITPYSVYRPVVGAPTEIQVADGMQYVNVAARLHVERRSNKAQADRDGVVMLRRSIDPNDKDADKRDWRIRGVDIRLRN